MNDNSPRCRLCGYNLKAMGGCDLCEPLRNNLIWPAIEDSESEVSAAAVVNQSLKAVKARLRRLNRELLAEDIYDTKLTKDLTALARTLKELAGEQRKLEDRDAAHYAKLGIEGRMALFIDQFFSMLPEDFQQKLIDSMQKVLESQAEPVMQLE